MNTPDTLRALVRNHLPAGHPGLADPTAPLELESLAMVKLLVDVEEVLSISFPDEALRSETFATLQALAAVVDRLRA